MNDKKTALFLSFFSLIFLPLSAVRIKNKPHKSLTNVKTLPELHFWEKVGGVKHPKPKKSDRPKVTYDIEKKEIDKEAVVRSNQIVLRNGKKPNAARRSPRIAALVSPKYCIFYPACHYQTNSKEHYDSHMLYDHQINENGEWIGENEDWANDINESHPKKNMRPVRGRR